MIKLLFKYLIPLVLMLAVFLVGYNYFFGTPEEKQKSNEIIAKFKDLGSEVFGLLHSEKEKYDAGKFDDALDRISQRIQQLTDSVSSTADEGQEVLDRIKALDEQRQALVSQLAELGTDTTNSLNSAASSFAADAANSNGIDELGAQIEALANQTQRLSDQVR